MYSAGITLNGKNSVADFGALLTQRDISPPAVRRITETLPYVDGEIDFTYMYGKAKYEQRTLTYTFEFSGEEKKQLRERMTAFENWILTSGESRLYDSCIDGYHFNVKPVSCSESEDDFSCEITAVFTADPFMQSNGGVYIPVTDFTSFTAYYDSGRLVYGHVNGGNAFSSYDISEDGTTGTLTVSGAASGFYSLAISNNGTISVNTSIEGGEIISQREIVKTGFETMKDTHLLISGGSSAKLIFVITLTNSVAQTGWEEMKYGYGEASETAVPDADNMRVTTDDYSTPAVKVSNEDVSPDKFSLPDGLSTVVIYTDAAAVTAYDSREERL